MKRLLCAALLAALLLGLAGCTALFGGDDVRPGAPAPALPTLSPSAQRLRGYVDGFLAAVPAGTLFEEPQTPAQLRANYAAPDDPLPADIYETRYDDETRCAILLCQTAALVVGADGLPHETEGAPWRFELCIQDWDSDAPTYVYCRDWPSATTASTAGTTTTAAEVAPTTSPT